MCSIEASVSIVFMEYELNPDPAFCKGPGIMLMTLLVDFLIQSDHNRVCTDILECQVVSVALSYFYTFNELMICCWSLGVPLME